tara:strand:+ start:111 stop:521 length:411 start_codon:yes stop_codon:yes gene_type:complete
MDRISHTLFQYIHVIAKFLSMSRTQRIKALNRVKKAEKRGYIKKRGENVKNYRKRWFILKGDLLYYFKTEQDSTPLGVIPLPSEKDSIVLEDEDEGGESCGFTIISPLRSYHLKTDTAMERYEMSKGLVRCGVNDE